MIEAFLTGLKSKVDELTEEIHNDFYIAIGGRFYSEEATQETEFPYAVAKIAGAYPQYTFTENSEVIGFDVHLYSDSFSDSEIHDIFAKWLALIEPSPGADWVKLTITSYTEVYLKRLNTLYGRDEDGIWYYILSYEAEIQD